MAAKAVLSVLSMAALATAATTPAHADAKTFRLTVDVLKYGDQLPGLQNSSEVAINTKKDACKAVLTVSKGPGAVFTSTGSTTHVVVPRTGSKAGVVVKSGGTATVPATFPVKLDCGSETAGVGLNKAGKLDFQNGVWMVCKGSVLGEDDSLLVLGYRMPSQRTLYGCAEVALVAS